MYVCEYDMYVLDVFVFGGDIGVKNVILMVMVGGDVDMYEVMLLLFNVFGYKVNYFGDVGIG